MQNQLNFDAVIIGSGLGGLTAGATLAKKGKKVLVLEQHYIPGGCATTFKRKDFVMEVGLHEMDGLHEIDAKTNIYSELGVFENIEFIEVPELYHYIQGETKISVPHGNSAFIEKLSEKFPSEREGIKKLTEFTEGVLKELPKLPSGWKSKLLLPFFPLLYPHVTKASKYTIGDWLDENIKNDELKLILLGNLAYYHDDPYRLSMVYFSAGQAGYVGGGGHFIKGGSQQLSNYLVSVIEENGGSLLLCKEVTEIIAEGKDVKGVRFKDANNHELATIEVLANAVIANASPIHIKKMLPGKLAAKLGKRIDTLTPSCSLISLYIGFDTKLKNLGVEHYSTNVFDKNLCSTKELSNSYKSDWQSKPFLFVDYGQIDSGLAPAEKSVGVICSTDYLADWKDLSPLQYKKQKEKVAQILINRLNEVYPGISNHIEHYELGTSKTIENFTWNPFGTPYGFEQSKDQSGFKRIQTIKGVKNLFFASAWSMPGGGFTGATISGFLAAQKILKKNYSNAVLNETIRDERSVRLIARKEIAQNTIELTFEKPSNFEFCAGQYAILSLINPAFNELDIPLRPLSIVSHPSEDTIRFAMRKSNSAFKRSCVDLKVQNKAIIYGPKGNFQVQNTTGPIVFLVAGIGITPVVSLLKELAIKNTKQAVHVLYSNLNKQTCAYKEELQSINIEHYQLDLIHTDTDGRINSDKLSMLDDLYNSHFYIIGNRSFLNGMTEILLNQLSIHEGQIHIDDFG